MLFNKYSKNNSNLLTRGFTLIEMLVVITIVAILAVTLIAYYLDSLKDGRNAKRRADAQSLKVAATLYANNYGSWPNATIPGTVYLPENGQVCTNGCFTALKINLAPYLDITQINDPSGNDRADGKFYYSYLPDSNLGCTISYQLEGKLQLAASETSGACSSGQDCWVSITCNK